MNEGLVPLELFKPRQRLLQHASDWRRRVLYLVQWTVGTCRVLRSTYRLLVCSLYGGCSSHRGLKLCHSFNSERNFLVENINDAFSLQKRKMSGFILHMWRTYAMPTLACVIHMRRINPDIFRFCNENASFIFSTRKLRSLLKEWQSLMWWSARHCSEASPRPLSWQGRIGRGAPPLSPRDFQLV